MTTIKTPLPKIDIIEVKRLNLENIYQYRLFNLINSSFPYLLLSNVAKTTVDNIITLATVATDMFNALQPTKGHYPASEEVNDFLMNDYKFSHTEFIKSALEAEDIDVFDLLLMYDEVKHLFVDTDETILGNYEDENILIEKIRNILISE